MMLPRSTFHVQEPGYPSHHTICAYDRHYRQSPDMLSYGSYYDQCVHYSSQLCLANVLWLTLSTGFKYFKSLIRWSLFLHATIWYGQPIHSPQVGHLHFLFRFSHILDLVILGIFIHFMNVTTCAYIIYAYTEVAAWSSHDWFSTKGHVFDINMI